MSNTACFDMIMTRGWPAEKVVIGMITNPENGPGWVPFELIQEVFVDLKRRYPGLGGVMAWEYFNSLPRGKERPWEWAAWMTQNISGGKPEDALMQTQVASQSKPMAEEGKDSTFADDGSGEAVLPERFEYFTDGTAEEL